eukprot:365821-Chlamydomonas_euryale.AAC.4
MDSRADVLAGLRPWAHAYAAGRTLLFQSVVVLSDLAAASGAHMRGDENLRGSCQVADRPAAASAGPGGLAPRRRDGAVTASPRRPASGSPR